MTPRLWRRLDQSPKPERFGRYVLLDRIGSGGMAEVFRAVMPGAQGFRQTFVVKRILAERSRAADFVEMFVQEARIGALLSHPNIVQVFDFGNVGGDYFLAMEYLRGRDVQVLMRKLRAQNLLCPVPVAAFIAHEVAVCLGYAHDLVGPDGKRMNIVHRDVSPSNIMCLRTGGVKLLDFGIAKAAGDQTENTEQGLFKGKLAYVAPERIKNEALDGRVDLFGLGVVLWEMLAGRRLFRGKSELETLNNVLEMKVPPPSAPPPRCPRVAGRGRDAGARAGPRRALPDGQAMADDLEPMLRETGFHPRMLRRPAARGVRLPTWRRARSRCRSVTPEMLAKLTEDVAEPGTGTLPSSAGASGPAMELATRVQHGGRGGGDARRWSGCCSRAAAAAARTRRCASAGAARGDRRRRSTPIAPLLAAPAHAAAAAPEPPARQRRAASPADEDAPAATTARGRSDARHRHRDRAKAAARRRRIGSCAGFRSIRSRKRTRG